MNISLMKKIGPSGPATAVSIGLFLLLALAPALHAATYYVDATNGNDSSSGLSENLAWKTMAKVNTSSFQPGSQILFRRGQSWGVSLVPRSSGLPGSPIVYGAYGTGSQPVIGLGTTTAVDIYNKSYITLADLEIRAADRCVNAISATAETKFGITIRDCKLVSAAHGIYINALMGGYDSISITNNHITPGKTALWQIGINFVSGVSNFTISGNTIGPAGEDGIMIYRSRHGIISGNTGGGNAENTIDVKNSHDIVISNNICSDDGESNIAVHEIDTNHVDATYNIIVENNTCLTGGQGDRMRQGYRLYSGIFFNYAKNSIVRYNRVEQAFGSGIFVTNLESETGYNQIYGNIILNCGTGTGTIPQGGIELGDCNKTKVYNNNIYNQQGSGGHGIYVTGGPNTAAIEIQNNIIHTAGGDLVRVLSPAHANYVSDYNCFYPDGPKFYWGNAYANSFSDWKTKSGADLHSLATNPQFNNAANGDFRLAKSSPCIDQGTDLGLSHDFKGIAIPQGKGPDVGAFEYVTVIPPNNFRAR